VFNGISSMRTCAGELTMEVSILPEILRPVLSRCAKVAKGRSNLLELTANEGAVFANVRDTHVSLTIRVEANVRTVGRALIDCAKFASVLAVRPDGVALQLRITDAHLTIKQREFCAKLPLFRQTVEAPVVPTSFDLELAVDAAMIQGALRCRHTVEEEGLFAGLLCDFSEPETLRIAAFTRAVLQVAHFAAPVGLLARRFVVAPIVVSILEGLKNEDSFRLAFSIEQSKAYFFTATSTVCVACLEDRYPIGYALVLGLRRWRENVFPVPLMSSAGAVVSERDRAQLVLRTQDVLAAVESAAVGLGRDDVALAMKIGQKLADGRIVVEFVGSSTANRLHATEKVLASGDLTASLSLGLHYAHFRDLLRHLGDEEFVLHVGKKEDPVVLVGRSSAHIVAVITIMRL
jgi:DNA polymerase III sliding clamp (beta) subunit (PCNA family)